MIIVLHGDDTASSYERLSQILDKFKDHLKVRLIKASPEEIQEAVLSTDLISAEKVVIVENFLSPFKKLPQFIEKLPQNIVLIFWEKTNLSPTKVQKLQKFAKVEFFKEKSPIFDLLDSISPNSQIPLSILPKLTRDDNLLWQLENRFLLMILSKLDTDIESVTKITKRYIFDWQWVKIKSQSSKFSLKTLLSLYNGSLKIEFMIKSGKTQLSENILLSVLFLKYL